MFIADCFDFPDEIIRKCVRKVTNRKGSWKRQVRDTTPKFVTNTAEQLFATVTLRCLRREVIGGGFVHNVCNSPFSSTVNLLIKGEASLEPPPLSPAALTFGRA